MAEPSFCRCASCKRSWSRMQLKMGPRPPAVYPHCSAGPDQQGLDVVRERQYMREVYAPIASLVVGAAGPAVESRVNRTPTVACIGCDEVRSAPCGARDCPVREQLDGMLGEPFTLAERSTLTSPASLLKEPYDTTTPTPTPTPEQVAEGRAVFEQLARETPSAPQMDRLTEERLTSLDMSAAAGDFGDPDEFFALTDEVRASRTLIARLMSVVDAACALVDGGPDDYGALRSAVEDYRSGR